VVSLTSLISKELRQTFRDKRVVALLVVVPVFQLVVLGYAVNLDVDHVPTIVTDLDRTDVSRRLSEALLAGDAFDLARSESTAEAAMDAITRGDAPLAVVIPRGFGEAAASGRERTLQLLIDGSDSNRAIIAGNAATALVLQEAAREARARLARASAAQGVAIQIPTVRVEPRLLYNPTLSSQHYFVPGVAATLLIVVTLIVTAMGLAREKESGTLEQVLVTPIRPGVLILGKTIPYAAIGLVDLGLVVTAGAWIFDVPIEGDLVLLAFAGFLYLLTTLGTGLLIATFAQTQQQAFMGSFLVVMPAILLSGFITPVANMPAWLQPVTAFNPVRHFVEVMRAVLLKDAGVADLAPQLVALLATGVVLMALATIRVRRM
jgi:ABC-2 type transport system permease protein